MSRSVDKYHRQNIQTPGIYFIHSHRKIHQKPEKCILVQRSLQTQGKCILVPQSLQTPDKCILTPQSLQTPDKCIPTLESPNTRQVYPNPVESPDTCQTSQVSSSVSECLLYKEPGKTDSQESNWDINDPDIPARIEQHVSSYLGCL